MAIARCRECGADVSSEAVVCPRCGISNPAAAVADRDPRTQPVDAHLRPAPHGVVDRHPARRRVRGGWRTTALLLLLVLVALFALWYGDVVNFT
jgi:hypothetical protein